MIDLPTVNGLPLPRLLSQLIESGRWEHPGDERLRSIVPFFVGAVDFLSVESMRRESSGKLADDPQYSAMFHMARGGKSPVPPELPWLDADRAVFIAVCRFPGDDEAIALDYRRCSDDPRVVACEWLTSPPMCVWREVAGTFTEFARRLGMGAA